MLHYAPFAACAAGANRAKLAARSLALATTLLLATVPAWPQAALQAVTDQISYNIGDSVRLRLVSSGGGNAPPVSTLNLTIRYAGETKPLVERIPFAGGTTSPGVEDYQEVWKIPDHARTGRYEIDLTALNPKAHQDALTRPHAASFTVHRKLVRIERVELDKTFYTPGDPVSCRAVLRNLTGRALRGLRVEFSERYWPWIAQSSDRAGVDVFPIAKELTLRPESEVEVRSARAATAKSIKQPAVQQYAVVVWDEARKNVYDIAFSPLTFIQPPGDDAPKPYPLQYIYPDLASVDTASYRQFSRQGLDSGAVEFNRSHTMYAPGDMAMVKFSVTNSTEQPWRGVKIRASLRSLGSAGFGEQMVAEKVDLPPHGARLDQEVKFALPSDGGGSYRAVVEVSDSTGQVLARGELELAANPLPASILIFCAHEDDEGAHSGIIRAAVENHIPIHIVYFTSGDAGSCDRYYQHSCSPAEALNFGALRMEEARAGLAHVGVPGENILFLGLPDGGSGEIWYRHIEPSNPYLSVLLASDHAPYDGLARPNLPYARRSAVDAAKGFIKQFEPEVIYTGHPDERHVDHRTNNWFVVKAMQELLREGAISPQVELRVDQVYGPGPQGHAPYRYEKHILFVTPEARALAQEASWFYQSQSGNRGQGRIRPLDQLPRQEIHWRVLDWKDHEGWNEKD